MFNPYEGNPLYERLRSHMEKETVPANIKTLIDKAFSGFLQNEIVVLTRNEKHRLYKTVVREMFDEILAS